ncbi:hypothetical protein IWZ00DRAFT_490135 [Phyllosticta capitalensis]
MTKIITTTIIITLADEVLSDMAHQALALLLPLCRQQRRRRRKPSLAQKSDAPSVNATDISTTSPTLQSFGEPNTKAGRNLPPPPTCPRQQPTLPPLPPAT